MHLILKLNYVQFHEIISILGNQKDIYSLSTLREDLVIYLKGIIEDSSNREVIF